MEIGQKIPLPALPAVDSIPPDGSLPRVADAGPADPVDRESEQPGVSVVESTTPTLNGQAFIRIVNVLQRTPGLSHAQIAERAFVGKTTLSGGGYLKKMKEAGLIHISGWLCNDSGRFTTPLYSAGPNEDLPRPHFDPDQRQPPGMRRLLAAIEEFGPLDYRRAAEIAALSVHTVKNAGYLEILVAQGKIHIAEWRRNPRGAMSPLYDGGPGKAAPRPEPLSQAEVQRRHRLHTSPKVATVRGQLRIVAQTL